MSTLVIIIALAGVLGVLAHLVSGSAKPATDAARNHRGGRGRRRSADVDEIRTPAWRQALSLVELALLTIAVGIVAAGVVAAVVAFLGSVLSSAI